MQPPHEDPHRHGELHQCRCIREGRGFVGMLSGGAAAYRRAGICSGSPRSLMDVEVALSPVKWCTRSSWPTVRSRADSCDVPSLEHAEKQQTFQEHEHQFSFQFSFYLYTFTIRIVSRAFTEAETQSPNPQVSRVARKKKKSLLTGINLGQDPAYKDEPSCWKLEEKMETGQRE